LPAPATQPIKYVAPLFLGQIGADQACCGSGCLARILLAFHNPLEGRQMALTWGSLIAGGLVVFALPAAVFWLNARKRNAGWWLLFAVTMFVVLGNIVASA
jgi:hypothetical protein